MKKMEFTDWNTVIINGDEMPLDKFFRIMDENIESYDYCVYAENNTIKICFKGSFYEAVLSDQVMHDFKDGILNSTLRHLLALSRIQKMVNITENGGEIASCDALDNDARVLYLQKLSNKKFSLGKYFRNLKEDLEDSLSDTSSLLSDSELLDELTLAGVSGIGLAIGILVAIITENAYFFLLIFSGFALRLLCYSVVASFLQIKNRLYRLIDNIKTKKLNKYKVKNLKQIVVTPKPLNLESGKEEELTIQNSILVMINKLVELLSEVHPINRGSLSSEIREILTNYQELSNNNTKSDKDIWVENKELCSRIIDLEMKINEAKKLNNTRESEVALILDKLDTLDEEKGKTYRKALK